MNPMVDLVIDMDDISEKSDSFFEKFDIVCLLGYSKHIQVLTALSLLVFTIQM